MTSILSETPLAMKCPVCSAPSHYNVVSQDSACKYCGHHTSLKEHEKQLEAWRNELKQSEENSKNQLVKYFCPNCSAEVYYASKSQISYCHFCTTSLMSGDFITSDIFPVALIPFYLDLAEAKDIFKDYYYKNKKSKEARLAYENIDNLKPLYMPFQLYQGNLKANIKRDLYSGSDYNFELKTRVNGIFISSSSILSNELLDTVEPFDTYGLKDFNYQYLAGFPAKTQDIEQANLNKRFLKEMKDNFEKTLGKKLHSRKLKVEILLDSITSDPILAPVYYLEKGKTKLVINGQTGLLSMEKLKDKISVPWIIEPVISCLIVLIIYSVVSLKGYEKSLDPSQSLIKQLLNVLYLNGYLNLIPLTICIGIFASLKSGQGLIRKKDYSSARLGRYLRDEYKNLKFNQVPAKEDALRNDFTEPLFFDKGQAVDIAFFPLKRILSWALILLSFLTSTLWLGLLLQKIIPMDPAKIIRFMDKPWINGMLMWWLIAIPATFVVYTQFLRTGIYNHPLIIPYQEKKSSFSWRREISWQNPRLRESLKHPLKFLKSKIKEIKESSDLGLFLGFSIFILVFWFVISFISAFK